jgi:Tfp pilus assembly protein PilZ
MPDTPSSVYEVQRASKRIRVLCPAHFRRQETDQASFATVVVINMGGLYLATPELLSPGREIDVTISLPGERQVFRSRARVVDAHPKVVPGGGHVPGVGCAFVEPPPELMSAIQSLSQF